MSTRTTKDFAFEIKTASDVTGEFEGFASVYGNVDSHGDRVMRGAFTETIRENGGRVVVLAQHDPAESIGIGYLTDTPQGLRIRGKLLLAIDRARAEYERVKAGLVRGLSIGYETRRSKVVNGVRELLDIKLYEVSLVTWGSNPEALVESVKAREGGRYFAPIWADIERARPAEEPEIEELADALRALRLGQELW